MHILTLLGSPRRRGNTNAVLSQFEALAAQQHTVERITIVDHDVRGCLGCQRCQKVFDQPGCPQKDEALPILERILAADLVIYATPLYAWDFTAQMKALFDRHFCLMKWRSHPYFSLMQGRRAALLVTCGDAIENNTEQIQVIFERQMACCQATVEGKFILPHCTSALARGEPGAQVASAMARQLLAA